MAFVLKTYQQQCLDELARYLRRTWELQDADTAFYEQTRRPYHQVEALKGLPYVCVRVPTGGGKTVLAAHAIGIAASNLLRAERVLVLWLAPTTQIVEQTLRALQDKGHAYRRALDDAFDGCVSVMDLKSALSLQRGTLDSDTVVIVSTMAAMRVENTDGRKIYEDNGVLMSNFEGLTQEQEKLIRNGDSGIVRSLANLLRLRRPVVVVDEAHNARTALSFESLARFNPSCILEFSATPSQSAERGNEPSNVLTHVSAAQLKTDEMIKLPILLKAKAQWVEAVQEALNKQSQLEKLALEEQETSGQYIRPIVLFQAQRNVAGENNITYDVLKKALQEEFNVPAEQIAVSTGAENDLEGVDVLRDDQKIRYIITVDKLREGWDCPFAYILCTVSNLRSSTAVEQLLGRILRMPYVTRRKHEELNHAYAYATSPDFVDSANALTEALVDSGFERFEAKAMIHAGERTIDEYLPLFNESVSETVSMKLDVSRIPARLRERLTQSEKEGKVEVVYTGPPMAPEETEVLKAAVADKDDKRAIERLSRKSWGQDASPSTMGDRLSVPRLAMRVDGQLELFEDQFREVPWKLSDCDASLSEQEFSLGQGAQKVAIIDVDDKEKLSYSFMSDLQRQLALLEIHGPRNENELRNWLDQNIPHPDITQYEAGLFIAKVIRSLIDRRGFSFEELNAQRWRLRDAVEDKISHHRRCVVEQAYQRMLSPDFESPLEADPTFCFTYDSANYPAARYYDGPMRFRKHYYLQPAQMNSEEAKCAAFIDGLPEVDCWVRNLERCDYSFWLPTSTDRFYPDFVATLNDGRVLIVEYKGQLWTDTPDTEEKTIIGQIYEARSQGRCLFRLVGKSDFESQILDAIRIHS